VRAAVDRIFGILRERMLGTLDSPDPATDPRAAARASIREFVRFTAVHPEMFQLMLEVGKTENERLAWLVETHLRPLYERLVVGGAAPRTELDGSMVAHAYYAVAGAASVMFAVAPECRRLTGLDPTTQEAIDTHAEFVARLMVP
jgi:TetR/AcrR family transcriptional regulator